MTADRSPVSTVLTLCLSIMVLLALADPSKGAPVEPLAEPTLLLDPTSLSDNVDPGDIFVTLGDVAIFWLDELNDQGTSDYLFDDTVRFALWRTDGTPEGTYPLLPRGISLFYYSETLNGVLFFAACRTSRPIVAFSGFLCDSPDNVEFWRTDATLEGTFPLLEEGEGHVPIGARVTRAAPHLGKFFFMASDEESGVRLWATDGSREGTFLVKNLRSLGLFAAWDPLIWGEDLYFLGSKLVGDTLEPWIGRSDGTGPGTSVFPAGVQGDRFLQGFLAEGEYLFLVTASADEEPHPVTGTLVRTRRLWALQKGTEEFQRVADLGYRKPLSGVHAVAGGGRLFFEFPELFGEGDQVWASDGQPAGTHLLGRAAKPSVHGHVWTEPFGLPAGRAFMAISSDPYGLEPWITDGDPEGTELLLDLCPGECSSDPVGMTLFGGWFYFSAEDMSHGRELWRWNPASGTVEMVADFCPGACGGYPILAEQADDRLFVRVLDPDWRWYVWQVGLDGSVQEVADFGDLQLGGFERLFNRGVYSWRIVGDRAVFWARDTEDRLGLWSMKAPVKVAAAPPGPGLTSGELPGFSVKVRITAGSSESALGRLEAACIPETLCVSGAVPGRSEVFVRVVGPRPNGRLWPTLVKFTTSTVEVWIEQLSTGIVRYYTLEGASPGSSELPGLFDRHGFQPDPT